MKKYYSTFRYHLKSTSANYPLELAKLVAATALTKKAYNLVLLELIYLADYADYFLIMSGGSTKQTTAIAEQIQRILKKTKIRILATDGIKEGRWALIDLGNVVIHIFHQPIREFYNLESFWIDAIRIPLDQFTY